jgi:hypothetical protein
VSGQTEENIRKEIDSLIREFCDLYDGDLSNDALALFLTELRKLSEEGRIAVRYALCAENRKSVCATFALSVMTGPESGIK